jgi:hypothetical protein
MFGTHLYSISHSRDTTQFHIIKQIKQSHKNDVAKILTR